MEPIASRLRRWDEERDEEVLGAPVEEPAK